MSRIIMVALLVTLIPLTVANGANIYLDIDSDVTYNEKRAPRLKLRKQKDLTLGRMAGVWGTVGKGDAGDAFFLGKSTEPARMRFTLAVAKNHSAVQMVITAKDGRNKVKHQIFAQAGETTEKWLELKGMISVVISSPSKKEAVYASYFWYPGDGLDGLKHEEFNRIASGNARKVTSFARRKQGGVAK